jgi:phenylpropionate dioxygenase-like ring-hydroxylating dioxygenase large terminal subunit
MTVSGETMEKPVQASQLAYAMPSWVYENAELARLEYERIIRPSWQLVCHESSIPKTGDFVTLDLGRDSVIVVRGRDGQIRAFENVCRHRAARILEGAGSCGGSIRCPYHAWAYDFDGSLRHVPENDSFPGLDKGEYGLHPVKTDRLMGLILVCLEGSPQPVSEMFAPFMADLEPYRIQDMQPIGAPYEEVWQANWKIAMDNYLESYHVPIGHPGLNRMFTPDYIGQIRTPEGVGYGVGQYHPTYSPKWGEREYQKLSPKVATHLPEGHRKRWRYFSVLPNMGIDVFPDQIDFFQVIPDGFGRTRIRGANFALPDDRREMKLLRYLNSRINRLVQREDAFLCDRVQKGIVTTGYQPGPLSEYEVCVKQFHDMIRERIPETRLAKAPMSFA